MRGRLPRRTGEDLLRPRKLPCIIPRTDTCHVRAIAADPPCVNMLHRTTTGCAVFMSDTHAPLAAPIPATHSNSSRRERGDANEPWHIGCSPQETEDYTP